MKTLFYYFSLLIILTLIVLINVLGQEGENNPIVKTNHPEIFQLNKNREALSLQLKEKGASLSTNIKDESLVSQQKSLEGIPTLKRNIRGGSIVHPLAVPMSGNSEKQIFTPSVDKQSATLSGLTAIGDPTNINAALIAGANYVRHAQSDVTEDNAGNGNPDTDNNDGGWDWVLTLPNVTHSSSPSPKNLYGATGLGLYYGYLRTNNSSFKIAMQDAADKMIADTAVHDASALKFLMLYNDLPGIVGTAYKDFAKSKYDTQIAMHGGTATLFGEFVRDRRGISQGYHNGIIGWDLGAWSVAAQMLFERFGGSYHNDAVDIANVAYNASFVSNTNYFDIVRCAGWDPTYANSDYWWYNLGISGLIDAFRVSGTHTTDIAGLVTKLQNSQASFGGFCGSYGVHTNDDDWQTTAYAVMSLAALHSSTYATEINHGAYYLAATQNANGGWVYSDNTHYPEVGGECTSALYFGSNASTVWVDDDYTSLSAGTHLWGYDAFNKIQNGIDAIAAGGTVNVYPGNYVETASNRSPVSIPGTYTFGLYIGQDKNGITVQGINALGSIITDYHDIVASVQTEATNNFGPDGIFMEGDNVTITGLSIWQDTLLGTNKTISVIGDNFTFKYCRLTDVRSVDPWGSLYIDDEMYNAGSNISHIQRYTIEGNWFYHCSIDPNNGAGYTGAVSGRIIRNNLIDLGAYAGASISFTGSGTPVPWFVHGVGGAVITGNTFIHNAQHIRVRGDYNNSQFDWSSFWSNNTFDNAVIVGSSPPSDIREYSYTGGYGLMNHCRRIGGIIQNEIGHGQVNDTVKVASGTYEEQIEITKPITLQGSGAGSTMIKSPVTLTKSFSTGPNNFPIVYIHDISGVAISNLTVDGFGRGNANYRFIGIGYRNAGGAINDCTIKDIRNNPIDGTQHGVGIYANADDGNARTLNVNNNTIYGFQKNGTVFAGANLTVSAIGNTITGAGAVTFIAQNGIQIYGATGNANGNHVAGFSYTPGTWTSTGMLIYNAIGSISITGNKVDECQTGIYFINAQGTISQDTVTNTLAGMGATPYWWGIVADPGIGKSRLPEISGYDIGNVTKQGISINAINALTTAVNLNVMNGGGNGTGIEADAIGTETLNFSANQNTVTNWGTGFVLYKDAGATLTSVLRRNYIAGNTYGVLDQTGVLQDARENWWGQPSGPADIKSLPNTPNYNNLTGHGDSVSNFIDYNPWYLDAGMTTLSVYTLTVNATNGGVGVTPPTGPYNHGTIVNLVPTPSIGYHFVNWTGTDVPVGHSTDNPLYLTMDGNKTITANFTINTYTLTLLTVGSGTAIKNPNQPLYNHHTSIQLAAIPAAGWYFTGWTGDVTGMTNPMDVFIDNNMNVTANFTINSYIITATVTGNGTISPSGGVSVNYGGNKTFNIAANPGHHLDSVVIDAVNRGIIYSYEFTNVTTNHTIKAYFGANAIVPTYVISATSGPNGFITPSGNLVVDEGESPSFTIAPEEHYQIDSVIVDGINVGAVPTYTFTNVMTNHSIMAKFAVLPPYSILYRSFTYEELPVYRPIKKKPTTYYWEFKIKNTTSYTIAQFTVKFQKDVLAIISSGGLVPIGSRTDWGFYGTLNPNDSIIIKGRSVKPSPQKIVWLRFSNNSSAPLITNIYPIYQKPEYPMPNLANVREDLFRLGAFSATNGFVVGVPMPQLPRFYGWVRMRTAYDVYKSLIDRWGLHQNYAHGFDLFDNDRPFTTEQKTLPPSKQNNHLFASLLTLKFNITASKVGITEPGFGELRFMESGNPYTAMLIRDIAVKADSLMTFYVGDISVYSKLDSTIVKINRAFSGVFDTLSWGDTIKIKGVRSLLDVPYLQPSGIIPERIKPSDITKSQIPNYFELSQNYPNPFNPSTTIQFTLPTTSEVTLKVFNVIGQEVATIFNHEILNEGLTEVEFEASNIASGIYFYRINAEAIHEDGLKGDNYMCTRKMLLLK